MTSPTKVRILPLADFKPAASSRAWVSIPNPNNLPLLATASSDKTARVYSLKNFTLHSTLEGGHSRSVRSVAWKPAVGSSGVLSIATGSFDATMGIWRRSEEEASGGGVEVEISELGEEKDEEADWEFAIVLEGHDSEVKNVAYSPSGQWLASCSRDKSVWIWEDIGEEGDDEFETIAVLQEHEADVKMTGMARCSRVLVMMRRFDLEGDDEGEWSQIALLKGHEGIVWCLDWEPEVSVKKLAVELDSTDEYPRPTPRLISSSSDCSIRIWSIAPAPPPPNRPSYFNTGIPSTMRPGPTNETWECTATLPTAHDLPIYSIGWSSKSGRVVSTGGDGKIVIYEETKKGRSSVGGEIEREWIIVGSIEGAHGPYEINHVAWCTRFDAGKKEEGEEMVISTGDDGAVRAWAIEDIVEQGDGAVDPDAMNGVSVAVR
ncbi:putative cytosolic iron-sulfur protein assembly protein [Lachnellula occidentalis]|uniref:Probable cytosolic iron-sulfur protein assembly protein 1 n=1 Tax=Lachnellula occidentalis TaxID=215460 RepID=A0A8H8REF3_9HELO|nr:putative cytosolic iron-sulfur protein assembly protein [Lachnellula occidentalis]